TREVFTQNFLFTKRLALKAAQDIIEKGQQKKEILSQVEDETMRLLASIKEGIYSEEVRLKQMAEITLLIDHYCLLIDAEGNDYTSWVINAYQSPENYIAFLEQLKEAEKEVYGAAMQTVGTQTSAEMVATMEKTTERVRMAAAEKIFRTTN
ncbi:MAG: NF038143 family protein, partial [Proteobacteria bacterium]|nr:NF038143 family protein [Pseudomonadota bacterium]